MNTARIVICDDIRLAADIASGAAKSILGQKGVPVELRTFTQAQALIDFCEKSPADLALLDIEMPGMDGIVLGQLLRERHLAAELIYISNREDRVFSALTVRPFGFVRKTHLAKDIESVLTSWAEQWKKKQDEKKIVVMVAGGCRNVSVSEILYIEGSGTYQELVLEGKPEPVRITSRMKTLEEELAPEGFLRIHKGYLVNFSAIDTIRTGEVRLKNGVVLPVSRGKTPEIKSAYLALCRKNGMMLF